MGLIEEGIGRESWAERHVAERTKYWSGGQISQMERSLKNSHKPALLVLTGHVKREDFYTVGTSIEKALFDDGIRAYRYGLQFLRMADADASSISELRQDMFRQLLDIGYAFMDAGHVFITAVRGLTPTEAHQLRTISNPFDVIIIELDDGSVVSDHVWSTTSASSIIDSIKTKISLTD